ncbi:MULTISPECIES: hypothetical protein [unclassified Paludibacterium]|uniref:hypothetical protein n=1 Tax=unclassified Paludibacterium TaxID=2618429 RepID=UPI001C05DF87|nr:hypothetical protein [Paludibacterium sp. B53371]BEV73716.1 hypothetical protein THUN1379_31980 [Paludibacterium sp. THUN1379]
MKHLQMAVLASLLWLLGEPVLAEVASAERRSESVRRFCLRSVRVLQGYAHLRGDERAERDRQHQAQIEQCQWRYLIEHVRLRG